MNIPDASTYLSTKWGEAESEITQCLNPTSFGPVGACHFQNSENDTLAALAQDIISAVRNDLLNKAFTLACFIHGDRKVSLRAVAEALAKLQVAATAQGKRLYYRPSGRARNKISFNEAHLLQRLVYIESEPYEIQRERGDSPVQLEEEDLLIHFIKHLVRVTIKRNSFYVTLGLGRLLHNYSTAETMDIYNAVIQDPERVKDDYYYRSRKGVLMQELKERFGDILRVVRGPHGEERFQAGDNSGRFADLVRDSLNFFTPWYTPCLVPAGINPITDGIPRFSYKGSQKEDEVEVDRLHAVIHSDCFKRLVEDLGFNAPEQRLEIPRFFLKSTMNDKEGPGGGDRRHATPLTAEELSSIKSELDDNASRRKATPTGSLLRIVVDGRESARLDLNRERSARFDLACGDELIEVRAHDSRGGDLLLATHLLAQTEEGGKPSEASIVLEGGQRLSFAVSQAGSNEPAVAEINYRETNPLKAAYAFLTRPTGRTTWRERKALILALACALLAISAALFAAYTLKWRQPTSQPLVTAPEQVTPQTAPQPGGHASNEQGNQSSTQVAGSSEQRESNKNPAKEIARDDRPQERRPPGRPGVAPEEKEITRSVTPETMVVPLAGVKKIYVEVLDDGPSSESVREMLRKGLGASGRLTTVQNRDEADALLKVSAVSGVAAEPGGVTVVARLLNARGELIWSSSQYKGPASNVADRILNDLLNSIRQAGRQK
ncbi:MAG TPA: hypothetical protein VGC87_18850 [Pyrinomonadaceae bacterium]